MVLNKYSGSYISGKTKYNSGKEQSYPMKARFLTLFLTLLFTLASLAVVTADNPVRDVSSNGNSKEVRRFEVTGPWGGDVRALVASPDNADNLYLGTSDGQIFRSTDGAQTWRRLKPGLGRRGLSVDSIVIDPHDTKTMYAGVWAVAHGEEGGVFKSEDEGEHWKLLDKTKKL